MTRLFIRFYLGVLAVLFIAWYLHGTVSETYNSADRHRVIEGSYQGAMRLLVNELNSTSMADRREVLEQLNAKFTIGQENPVRILPLKELPLKPQRRIARGDDIVFHEPTGQGAVVFAPLQGGQEVVRLGPLPGGNAKHIEDGLGGGVRLAAEGLRAADTTERDAALQDLTKQFGYPVLIASSGELPEWVRERFSSGDEIVFYQSGVKSFIVTPLSANQVLRFGPFPNFEEMDQKAVATTLALVLLPAALAIAMLLRPVARQLRQVEIAAKAIAGGDLSARVDEGRVKSAGTLAKSFNQMACRTESLVRTQRELLQAVSHELRTPLSRMRFAIDLIDTAKDDAERKNRLASLDAATEELDELVGELLSYVRMETADPHLDPQPIVVQDAFRDLIEKHSALHPSIDFDALVQRPNVSVEADPASFGRAIGNLLNNAGRFAQSRVAVNASQVNGLITIDVDDDGSGIPESDRDRVFDPFVRLDSDNNGRGAGLGLALVQRIVKRHGGNIEVLSNPMGGCRIRSTWPATK
jgi:two-component system sensor histidine kinase RstB